MFRPRVPRPSSCLLGRRGAGSATACARAPTQERPFNFLRAVYLSEGHRRAQVSALYFWSDSGALRPSTQVFFLRRGGVLGAARSRWRQEKASCTTWSLGIGTFSLLSSFSHLREAQFRVRFFVCRPPLGFLRSRQRQVTLPFVWSPLPQSYSAWFRISFDRRRLEVEEHAFDFRPRVVWLNCADRACFPLHRVSSWRPVDEECSSAADIRALVKIPGPSRDVPKSDGDHIAPTTSVSDPQKKQTCSSRKPARRVWMARLVLSGGCFQDTGSLLGGKSSRDTPLRLDAQRTDRDTRVLNLFDVWSKIVSLHRGSKKTVRHSYLVRLVHLQSASQASSQVRRSGSAECKSLKWRESVWSKWRTPPELPSQTFFPRHLGVHPRTADQHCSIYFQGVGIICAQRPGGAVCVLGCQISPSVLRVSSIAVSSRVLSRLPLGSAMRLPRHGYGVAQRPRQPSGASAGAH